MSETDLVGLLCPECGSENLAVYGKALNDYFASVCVGTHGVDKEHGGETPMETAYERVKCNSCGEVHLFVDDLDEAEFEDLPGWGRASEMIEEWAETEHLESEAV